MDYTIAVRQYGLLRPQDWGPDCEAEMARMTALWNRLVTIDHEARANYFKVVESTEVAAWQAEIDTLTTERTALVAERAAARKAARSKVKTPELDARIAVLKSAIAERITEAKLARKREQERCRPQLAAVEERRRAAVKLARQESGLYWGNYNAVVASYERGRQAAMKNGAELKPHHHNADRITNQIQGGISAEALLSDGHPQVKLAPGAPHMTKARHLLTATIYTGTDENGRHMRRTVTWPMVLHRPFPDGAVIQEVVITRKSCAGRWHWNAVFTCRVPLPASTSTENRGACGVDVGWRMVDGGLRVAMIAHEDGSREEIVLPQRLVDRALRYYELGSARHQDRHEMLERLQAFNWERAPAALRTAAEEALAKRDEKGQPAASGLDLRRVAATWALAPTFHPEARQEALDWAQDDRRSWLAASGRRRTAAARKDFYRNVAARLVAQCSLIGLEKLDLAKMSEQGKETLPPQARRMRVIAAVAELRQAIESAAKREGIRVHHHAGKSSFVCHACHHETAVPDRSQLYFTCGGCGRTHDQDVNAATNLLNAALASAPVMQETPGPLAWEKRLAGRRLKRQREPGAQLRPAD
jgi:hypothetical protein